MNRVSSSTVPIRAGIRGRGGKVPAILLAPVLLVIILGSLLLAYVGYNAADNSGRARRAKQILHFRCTKCGAEFTMSTVDFANQAAKEPVQRGNRGMANCPSCKEKFVAAQLLQCTNCQKWYIPVATNVGRGPEGGAINPIYICPYCQVQWDPAKAANEARRGR